MTGGRLSFLGHPVPPGFHRRVVTIAPRCELAISDDEWRDALVVVEHGKVELEGRCGEARRVEAGAVLWIEGLALRTLRNHGPDPAVLTAVSRCPGIPAARRPKSPVPHPRSPIR
jgi:quercetin dioxygenase-like cupin family protein